jgi:hypothetical protein
VWAFAQDDQVGFDGERDGVLRRIAAVGGDEDTVDRGRSHFSPLGTGCVDTHVVHARAAALKQGLRERQRALRGS